MSKQNDFMDFRGDRANVFLIIIDGSGSMHNSRYDVINGMKAYKESFMNDFSDPETVAVSVSVFSDWYNEEPFVCLSKMEELRYNPDGYTALYYSICKGAEQLIRYMNQIREKMHIEPMCTFIFFSDGKSEQDHDNEANAKAAIKTLNEMGVNTVFVAFTDAIQSAFGTRLGFQASVDVNKPEELCTFLGQELSQSCSEQSKSAVSLGANFIQRDFFSSSTASGDASSELTGNAETAIDESFLDDI